MWLRMPLQRQHISNIERGTLPVSRYHKDDSTHHGAEIGRTGGATFLTGSAAGSNLVDGVLLALSNTSLKLGDRFRHSKSRANTHGERSEDSAKGLEMHDLG